jgi:ribonuclease G
MQSAFVDIGLDSDAFLYVSDFLENLEDYDHIVTTVEGKVEKMEQQGGQVFAPPGGRQPSALEPPEVTSASAETPGESAAGKIPPTAAASAAPPPPAAHPYEHRDRGAGGYGRDRGGRGRWGRHRRHGRDLPSSKYASRGPHEPRPYAPREYPAPPLDQEPEILPGESLAKYRNRIPATPRADAQAPVESTPPERELTAPPAESRREQFGAPLPESLYVAGASEHPPAGDSFAAASGPETPAPELIDKSDTSEAPELTPTAPEEHIPTAHHEVNLTEEEVTTLAEQLAEAKHEEAQAEEEETEPGD